jgi:hypothetical protein
MNWSEIDERYVRQGELLLELEFVKSWSKEVRDMNESKEGRLYNYPESFITFVAITQAIFHLPNRQTEGFFRSLSKLINTIVEAPDHTTIGRRVSRLNLDNVIDGNLIDSNEPVVIAVDSSGIKVTNRGDWIRNNFTVGVIKWLIHISWSLGVSSNNHVL